MGGSTDSTSLFGGTTFTVTTSVAVLTRLNIDTNTVDFSNFYFRDGVDLNIFTGLAYNPDIAEVVLAYGINNDNISLGHHYGYLMQIDPKSGILINEAVGINISGTTSTDRNYDLASNGINVF